MKLTTVRSFGFSSVFSEEAIIPRAGKPTCSEKSDALGPGGPVFYVLDQGAN